MIYSSKNNIKKSAAWNNFESTQLEMNFCLIHDAFIVAGVDKVVNI